MRFELVNGRKVADLHVHEEDLVNMDATMAYVLHPLVLRFRERTGTFPEDVESEDDWVNILDQIIEALKLIKKHHEGEWLSEWEWAKIRTGTFLLGKHFVDMWI